MAKEMNKVRREKFSKSAERIKMNIEKTKRGAAYMKTGIPGFDELFAKGIGAGTNILISGGPGSGKTVFCLQTLYNNAVKGHPCLYVTFEESPEKLRGHMRKFGWDVDKVEGGTAFTIRKMNPFQIVRSVDALFKKAAERLPMELDGVPQIIPTGLKPYMIAIDSLSALSSAFGSKSEKYRIYIEQLFELFERLGATTFLITETEEEAYGRYSRAGVEEFLADGVFIMHNIKLKDLRLRGIEVLKMRGEQHESRIVPLKITSNGITAFPEERIYEIYWAE